MIRLRNQIKVRDKATGGAKLVVGNPIMQRTGAGVARQAPGRFFDPSGQFSFTQGFPEIANYGSPALPSFLTGPTANSRSFSYINGAMAQYDTLLSGLVSEDEENNYRFYRDIYKYDSIAGAAVDLLSTLPFSDFTLTGIDEKRLEKYRSSIERLNLKTLFPEMSVDFLSMGKFVGTLIFRNSERIFTDIMPHRPENVTISATPFLGVDPVITVKQSQEIREFLDSNDRRIMEMRRRMNPAFINALRAEEMVLDPATTIFMPRKTFTTEMRGLSFFKRILPIYMLEKTLYRGTLIEAGRRQRSLVHLAVGETGEWEPTPEELQAIVTLFQQADLDPLGAIIATRNGVVPSEIRQGGDFWKWTDITDILMPMKLRALGISEAFLSGDVNFNTAEMALSVFMENLRAYREMVTQRVFTYKLLPLIAVLNDFYKEPKKEEKASTETENQLRISYKIQDTSNLDIPKVQWQKALRPEADTAYMEILRQLKDEGIPIPMRTWAAAGGLSLDAIEKDLQEEQQQVRRITELKKKQQPSEEGEEGEGGMGEFSSATPLQNFLNRDYGELSEVYTRSKTGRKKWVYNQKAQQERIDTIVAAALERLADKHNYDQALKRAKQAGMLKNFIGKSG